jgi:cysteine desulfurase/selenocysteine lyase
MVHGKPLAYLDNGASAQRPNAVIDAVDDYERHHHANIHRGVHTLSQEATALYEAARDRVVISSTPARGTRSCSCAARPRPSISWRRATPAALKSGDEILITHLEHHANIVPWQMVCEQTGAKLVVAPIDRAAKCTSRRSKR